MNDQAEDPALPLQEEVEQTGARPARPTIHFTQLPDGPPNSPITAEWNLYRRIVGHLLAEGHEGKWLLIRNEQVIGIWDTEAEADAVRVEQFPLQPVMMKQILAHERILRIGFNRLCRS